MADLPPIVASLDWALRPASGVVLVMTHPSFRQPRHAGWGFDASRKLVFRRVDAYLTSDTPTEPHRLKTTHGIMGHADARTTLKIYTHFEEEREGGVSRRRGVAIDAHLKISRPVCE